MDFTVVGVAEYKYGIVPAQVNPLVCIGVVCVCVCRLPKDPCFCQSIVAMIPPLPLPPAAHPILHPSPGPGEDHDHDDRRV